MAPTLGYWEIRGLAQPIRLLLAYTETEYEDKRYTMDNFDEWFKKDKQNLDLDFPNLPYYIDGELRITQSSAIMRYIAQKNNMCGTTDKEKVRVAMLENCIIDFRSAFTGLCYNSDFENLVAGYKAKVGAKLELFEKFLGDKPYLFGDKLTYPDFMLYEMIDQHKIFDKALVEPFKKLMAFADRFEAIPQVAAYKKSEKYIERPINGKSAAFK